MKQVRWIKQNIGLRGIFSGLALFLAALVSLFTILGPVVYQSRENATYATSIDNLKTAQARDREDAVRDRERQTKTIEDAVARIEAAVKQSNDLAEQNRDDVRAVRAALDGAMVELRQDTKALWDKMTDLKSRVGFLENKQQK